MYIVFDECNEELARTDKPQVAVTIAMAYGNPDGGGTSIERMADRPEDNEVIFIYSGESPIDDEKVAEATRLMLARGFYACD